MKNQTSNVKSEKYFLPTLEELLEAGVHFGHQSRRWNPKIAPYLYKEQNKVHIFDLLKTYEKLKEAAEFLYNLAGEGKIICFLGTKKQASEIIKNEAVNCGALYVNERWTGGMITNFDHVRNKMRRLKEIELGLAKGGQYESYTKKERLDLERQAKKLEKEVGGVRNLERVPDALFVVDIKKESTAVSEAIARGVDVVALVDSNCDPTLVAYPIPGNDDAGGSIEVITKALSRAVAAGREVWQAHAGEKGEKTETAAPKMEKETKKEVKESLEKSEKKEKKKRGRPKKS
ncbi:MAG: 30S ribosomal protein S2 [Patescibacteria group bacterium]|nr:30S ribosomal protein S2 [Patescibacteria group bacterium]